MIPVDFKERNRTLVKPDSMTDEECISLPVFTNGQVCVSCWEMSEEEKQELLKTGKVWLSVWSGATQPPVCVTAKNPITNEANEEQS
ncbi:MAG: hypothetical protein WCS27_06420 [Victivallaceae bacterium]|jgi:hypothetical protein